MDATPRAIAPSINGWSAEYLEAQHQRWLDDPASVAPDLASFFQGFDLGRAGESGAAATTIGADTFAVAHLCRAYREVGHLAAKLDPFGVERERPRQLSPAFHGLGAEHLDRSYHNHDIPGQGAMTLREIIAWMEETYCGSCGIEFWHIDNDSERAWLQEQLETTRSRPGLNSKERLHVLLQLHKAEMFETFLHKRYRGQKRFSLEGGESVIPLLDWIVQKAPGLGVCEIVFGMAHRGRLNVLANILGKTYEQVFTEFEENWDEDFVEGGGDVKYHLGYSGDRKTVRGEDIRLVLSSNPSHLEAANGVVLGRCRAKQRLRTDEERSATIPMLIHGDAAFIGQGVVAEIFNMSQLKGYTCGGTIHAVINNMIGFTTGSEDSRSSHYCTDLSRAISAPVFHVSGEDPEAVVHMAEIALRYRQKFKKDAVIDMWCYRKWGHNEGDDPSYTQPLMADRIKSKKSALACYAERLLAEGVIDDADITRMRDQLNGQMERAQSAATQMGVDPTIDPGSWRWQGFTHQYSFDALETGVDRQTLLDIAQVMTTTPEGFAPHERLAKQLARRTESVVNDEPLDWGTVESLAFGSLLVEGVAVRLSGQDSRRGTFSHRHAVLRDITNGEPYVPMNHLREMGLFGVEGREPGTIGADGKPRQAKFCVYDSPLSEYGVLAFEYGYSLADPHMLVIWEAQFGDFANTAQVVIDQFISAAELKWQRWSGLTLLLPHGYEGQGPEHSSARLERYLQLCADDNMQVVNPTTPAQMFHMFRRQAHQKHRKPLVVMSPKSLLRHPGATSRVDELTHGCFREFLDDPGFVTNEHNRADVRRVVLCCGKVYYDLVDRRRERGLEGSIAIIRAEQVYPLHAAMLESIVSQYPDGADRVWVQEEPRNAGAYQHFDLAVREALGWAPLRFIGRPASASPATGSRKQHLREQEFVLGEAIDEVGVAQQGSVKTRSN
ncbi:MAG: 2-oxoglutarate dehydrogenase E1 component [Phycisphaeraceae bacterium]|nr:2-oxoglutarate dehydrogenase E1 component [Phycisphaeraceae bacterium]MCB9847346.1 2-oxoglutarate dehydrogenase E1 component [Phycisphaeraceae bacterium]